MIKRLIFQALCNSLTGSLIRRLTGSRVPNVRWKRYRFNLTDTVIAPRFVASVFWGFYESAESRLLERHLSGNHDVVELGASIGVISSHVAAKLEAGTKLVAVEPNPNLLATLKCNVERHLPIGASIVIENAAFSTSRASVALRIGDHKDHTATQIHDVDVADTKSLVVPATSLSAILARQNLDKFTLVCDIEGAEIELLKYDLSALDNCQQLFIELHETTDERRYSVQDLVELINQAGFQCVDSHGNAFYFSRPGNQVRRP